MKKTFLIITMIFSILFFMPNRINALELTSTNDIMAQNSYKVLADNGMEFDPNRYDEFDTNCKDMVPTLKIAGKILLIAKIVLPLIIIVKASFDMLSTVTKGDSGEIKKKATKTGISIIGAIMIFFIPTLMNVIFDIVGNASGKDTGSSDSEICKACIFEPYSNKCNTTEYGSAGSTVTDRTDLE